MEGKLYLPFLHQQSIILSSLFIAVTLLPFTSQPLCWGVMKVFWRFIWTFLLGFCCIVHFNPQEDRSWLILHWFILVFVPANVSERLIGYKIVTIRKQLPYRTGNQNLIPSKNQIQNVKKRVPITKTLNFVSAQQFLNTLTPYYWKGHFPGLVFIGHQCNSAGTVLKKGGNGSRLAVPQPVWVSQC